ncbi:GNAT family N-acetyltransferase [Pseudomonas sp. CAU 1711]|uniref:GNAT family N-acetyltransferase n=1 Tax=Pseudomonas sp. CAU 1711 TaxID=3140356 RepID=UPI00325FF056
MPRSDALIRTASLDDLPLIQQLGRTTYVDHFAGLWSAAGLEQFLAQDFASAALESSLGDPGRHQWLLAFAEEGEAIGLSKTNWGRANPLTGVTGAELQKIYLRRAAVGQGIGERLLSSVLGSAREKEQANVWLDVLKSNSGAQQFYARHGFRKIGEIAFASDLQEIGMLVMLRQL